jgi:hypothetical protein
MLPVKLLSAGAFKLNSDWMPVDYTLSERLRGWRKLDGRALVGRCRSRRDVVMFTDPYRPDLNFYAGLGCMANDRKRLKVSEGSTLLWLSNGMTSLVGAPAAEERCHPGLLLTSSAPVT